MSSEPDLDTYEPPLKRECIEEELSMVNDEHEMEIELNDAADDEVDPLMPTDTNDPGENDNASFFDFPRPIKDEAVEDEDSSVPKIATVISGFDFPMDEIPQSVAIVDCGLLGSSSVEVKEDIDISHDLTEDGGENTTEFEGRAISISAGQAVAEGPEHHQVERSQQLTAQYATVLRSQLSKPSLRELDTLNNPQAVRQVDNDTLCGESQGSAGCSSPPLVQGAVPMVASDDSTQSCPSPELSQVEPHPEPTQNPPTTPQPVSVTDLLRRPFTGGTWTSFQQKAIVNQSPPKPEMDCLQASLTECLYSRIPALCGCSPLQRFFCWPCLLVFHSQTRTIWFTPAALALKPGFHLRWETHAKSDIHIEAEKTLNGWLQEGNLSSAQVPNPKRRFLSITDEKVRRQRKLMLLLVQSICCLKEENHNAQIKDYLKCFDYILKSNWELQEALKDLSTNSEEFVSNFGANVEKSIEKYLKSKILDEITKARFVTVFMEDSSSIVDNSHVVVILHFVDQNCKVQERIVELDDIGYDRSAATVFMVFQRVVFQMKNLRLKVAGFTYSSTVIHPNEISAFNERVERLCPMAKFFHYQGHNLTGMLFGALSHLNRKCNNFFQLMTELRIFFNKHLVSTFHRFERLNESRSESQYQSYDFDHGFVTTLKRSYSSVVETVGSILARPGDWDAAVSSEAPIFMSFLQDNLTRFLVVLISQLNLTLLEATEALQGKIDATAWKLLIRRAVANFISIKNFGFNDIYVTSLCPVLSNEGRVVGREVPAGFLTIFNEVIDTAISFLHQRFDSSDFGYIDLETVASKYYSRMRLKPDDIFRFRLQIQILAKDPFIKDKSLPESLKCFHEYDLALAIPEYATFLKFAMTIPSSNSLLYCPAVDRIHRQRQRISARNLIWMEKELLADVSKNKKSCDAIIDSLASSLSLTYLTYKKSEDSSSDTPLSQK